jgi:methionyl-tRNA formyltransferase
MGRVKVLGCGYRWWAVNAFERLAERHDCVVAICQTKDGLRPILERTENGPPDLILCFGWSWMVPNDIVERYPCLCLHPSDLPKYRGGSPLQHQILDGVLDTKATLFRMTVGEVDSGPLVDQGDLSLRGNIEEIYERLEYCGYMLAAAQVQRMVEGRPLVWKEQEGEPTTYKRRKPKQSEITIDELTGMPGEMLYNKIRMLTDPYPNAFIRTIDGGKLYLTEARYEPPRDSET